MNIPNGEHAKICFERSAHNGSLLCLTPIKSSKPIFNRAFKLVNPKLWNHLPQDTRTTTSLRHFKLIQKHSYFSKFFHTWFLNFHLATYISYHFWRTFVRRNRAFLWILRYRSVHSSYYYYYCCCCYYQRPARFCEICFGVRPAIPWHTMARNASILRSHS